MNLFNALKAFLQVFFGKGECLHPRVNLLEAPTYCPDCGYLVKIEWVFTHCRRCNTRRIPYKTFWGEIKPLQQYCRHCGHGEFKIFKKNRIEAFELMHAFCSKSTAYADEPDLEPYVRNPFQTTINMCSSDVFEAEVVNKSEYTRHVNSLKPLQKGWDQASMSSSLTYQKAT